MFQNPTIAKDHGKATQDSLIKDGVAPAIAASLGRQAEATKLAELDKWTVENVGLD